MSLTEKVLIWVIAGAVIASAVYLAFEAMRDFDSEAFYE
jgi:cell division protein FtsL